MKQLNDGWTALARLKQAQCADCCTPALHIQLVLHNTNYAIFEGVAAARRRRVFAETVKPQLDTLLAEVANGHSVVVLQNLGLSWWPRWHYAVMIGYDLPADDIFQRSGPNQSSERLIL